MRRLLVKPFKLVRLVSGMRVLILVLHGLTLGFDFGAYVWGCASWPGFSLLDVRIGAVIVWECVFISI